MSLLIDATRFEGKLRKLAAKRGMSAQEYAVTLLSTNLDAEADVSEEAPFYATATNEEWNRAFDAWVGSHANGPSLPDSALTRESFYEDRV